MQKLPPGENGQQVNNVYPAGVPVYYPQQAQQPQPVYPAMYAQPQPMMQQQQLQQAPLNVSNAYFEKREYDGRAEFVAVQNPTRGQIYYRQRRDANGRIFHASVIYGGAASRNQNANEMSPIREQDDAEPTHFTPSQVRSAKTMAIIQLVLYFVAFGTIVTIIPSFIISCIMVHKKYVRGHATRGWIVAMSMIELFGFVFIPAYSWHYALQWGYDGWSGSQAVYVYDGWAAFVVWGIIMLTFGLTRTVLSFNHIGLERSSGNKARKTANLAVLFWALTWCTMVTSPFSVAFSIWGLVRGHIKQPTGRWFIGICAALELISWSMIPTLAWYTEPECWYSTWNGTQCDWVYTGWIVFCVFLVMHVVCGITRIVLHKRYSKSAYQTI